MTQPNQENQNTLKSWVTGKLAMSLIGLAIGAFLYQSGVLTKLTGKLFSKKKRRRVIFLFIQHYEPT